jgi:hypothetical protein
MLMLDLVLGLNTNVGAQEILHLLTKKWEFLLLRAECYEFSNNSVVLSSFPPISAMSFILHILLVDNMNKLEHM